MPGERTIYELRFRRGREARFMSHLDTLRTLSRALRRSALTVYFTEGFNPKPKISYVTPPLAVGHTSECERVRFMLMEEVAAEDAFERVATQLPQGLAATGLTVIGRAGETGGEEKLSSASIEYFLFFRKDTLPGPADTIEALAAEHGLQARAIGADDIAGVLFFGNSEARDPSSFAGEYFSGGVSVVIPGGAAYKRPEKIVAGFIPLDPLSLFCHRKREV